MLIKRYKDISSAGVMLSEVSFSNFPLIMYNAGMDFVILDAEHGPFDYSTISHLVMNAKQVGIPIIVRLAENSRKDITKVMDMGADGLLLPMTNTAEDIEQVVCYAKYQPLGRRGVSTNRAHTLYNPGDFKEYMKDANDSTMIFAQIETKLGLENIKDIVNVSGVTGIFVGPNDLSCDMGCIGNTEPIISVIHYVGKEAVTSGKRAGIITEDDTYLDEAKKAGFDLLCSGSEISFLKKGGKFTSNKIHQM